MYRDHEGLFLAQKSHAPTKQPNVYFVTTWQHFLGIAKPKNVFRSTLNLSYILVAIMTVNSTNYLNSIYYLLMLENSINTLDSTVKCSVEVSRIWCATDL